ncbi:hypothetical protein [Streptomyces sp. CB02009]|uniref:hypothetical protein n=1 Tax=Streptomyces sp. CB02009 TaxID=1703938 RepID=UPI00093FC4AE|nr:hypothetical protein [Streptomyces sp. CB02009]
MNDDDYCATELGSHWFEHPAPDIEPDRVEGDVLRFGPGVTSVVARRAENTPTAALIWHGALPGGPPPASQPRRRRRPLRYVPAALILCAVLLFLAWWNFGPQVAVRSVAVTTPGQALDCNGTANVVGVVRANGRPGTFTYHWERSDGTRSGTLRETLSRGQEEASLHLLWTFHGTGSHRATARLVVTSPTSHTAEGTFAYHCT